jgi:hypothetical protein
LLLPYFLVVYKFLPGKLPGAAMSPFLVLSTITKKHGKTHSEILVLQAIVRFFPTNHWWLPYKYKPDDDYGCFAGVSGEPGD